MTLASTANWPTSTGVMAYVYTTDSNNAVDTSTLVGYKGVISGSTIGSLAVIYGTDQLHSASAKVTMFFGAPQWDDLITGLLISLDQDGTLKAGAVDVAAVLASNVVTTAKILNANVTADKLATGATSAYVATGETTTSTSYADLTTTTDTVTVTVGANGLALLTLYAEIANTTANSFNYMTFAASGTNTIAAADIYALKFQTYAGGADGKLGATHVLTGLTPGSTTFKLKYKVATGGSGAGTATFTDRRIGVVPL